MTDPSVSNNTKKTLSAQLPNEQATELHPVIETASLSRTSSSSSLPSPFLPLSPHYPMLNAFSHFLGWAVLFVVLLLVHLFVQAMDFSSIFLILLATITLTSTVYGYYFAQSCGYFHGKFELLYKEGIWWKKQTALSFSRIQHIDISHGPLERHYKMTSIKFFTAGGAASDLKIPGLDKQVADSLRTEILQYAKNEFDKNRANSPASNQANK